MGVPGLDSKAMSDEAMQTSVEEHDDELATEAEAPEGLDPEAQERRAQALSRVIKFGDPVLRSAASPVTQFDERLAPRRKAVSASRAWSWTSSGRCTSGRAPRTCAASR